MFSDAVGPFLVERDDEDDSGDQNSGVGTVAAGVKSSLVT